MVKGKMERRRQIQDECWNNSVREAELAIEHKGESNQEKSTVFT